jgi:hypothetical protein
MVPLVVGLLGFHAGGCGGGIDRDVEKYVTIDQGVFGQIVIGDDLGTEDDAYYSGLNIQLLPATGSTSVATAVSNDRGFYEMAAPPGDYQICGTLHGDWCKAFAIPMGLRRVDGRITGGLLWYY